jgi:thioredoxin reductase (NADPH)
MRQHLASWKVRLGFCLEVVDIDTDPELKGRLAVRIPVLMDGPNEICHYRLDETALLRHFQNS